LSFGFSNLSVTSGFRLEGAYLATSSVQVLVVDDYEPFRRFIRSTLRKRPELQIVCEASDGLEAVNKADELQPDLIVLDIGLPSLNGIEAARRIRKVSPESKILFISQESSADVVQEALALGALGYVVKAHAGSELLAAVGAVLENRQYISSGLSGHYFTTTSDSKAFSEAPPSLASGKAEVTGSHEVEFYSDDPSFLIGLIRLVEAAFEAGSKVIVVATESHRNGLLQGLQARGVDTAGVEEHGCLVLLDAAEVLSTFMEDAVPNRERFLSAIAPLIRCAEVKHQRVVLLGEMAALLCAEGRMNAAIELERLGNELAQTHPVCIRCAYPMTKELKGEPYAAICAEHSAVLSAEA
jgi:DNA-binding NarL/FixJ family response regulator